MAIIGTPVETFEYVPDIDEYPDGCVAVANLPTVPGGTCETPTCEEAFLSLRVTPTIAHGSRVDWALSPGLTDSGPYTFQLQGGNTGLNQADDWCDIGSEVVDTYYALDDEQRVYGKTNWSHYRVVLTTPQDTYYSPPIPAYGDLDSKDRREWQLIAKSWQRQFRIKAGNEGYLLKRKLFGEKCSCVDFQTGEINDPECELCYGTGFVQGYYDPVPCFYAQLSRLTSHNERDGGQARGTIDDRLRVRAKMLAVPMVFENDVWVDKSSDHRWYIHEIQNHVEIRGVAAVIDCELRLAPFSDPIYQIAIADQIPQG
jgi:hypothetical protein